MKKFDSKTVRVGSTSTTSAKTLKTKNMKKTMLRKKPEAKAK
jgi:hypothetical protein